ncbi:MAG TPA: O-antigen translocase [Flavobacteriaceae bacterium]
MRIKEFIKTNLLFKVTSINSLVVLIRMLFSLASQKVLAIVIGAEGLALVGNFRNIFNFLEQFSIFGAFNGLVKYISEHKNNKAELSKIGSTAIVFTFIASLISFIVLFFGANQLNDFIFGAENHFDFIFKISAFMVPFFGFSGILNSFLNGHSDYKNFAKATIFTVIISTALMIWLTITNNLKGSLLAISFVPLLQFLGLFLFAYKKYHAYFKNINFELIYKNKLLSYTLMTLVVVLLVNWIDVVVRNLIKDTIGGNDAGYWTAMTSISKTYMQFSATIFPLYILPKYSKMTSSFEFRKEVVQMYKFLIPVFAFGMLLIFLFKNLVIQVLYTNEFLSMSNLFKWQLLGDLTKLAALIISYIFLAKRQIGYFIFTEVLSVILFYGFSKYFILSFGTEGIVIANFVRYVVYFLVVLFILRHNFIGKERVL